METPLLSVKSLTIGIRRPKGSDTIIVDDLSFDIQQGERFGIVGDLL